jgi:hypothetical protein
MSSPRNNQMLASVNSNTAYFLCWKWGTQQRDGVRLKAPSREHAIADFALRWELDPNEVLCTFSPGDKP